MAEFTVRTMTPAEVGLAVEWAAREGWNPGVDDAEAFRAADPGGFLTGELDGEPVGCISVVSYGEAFGFLGLYIVRPEFRGRGYGLQLWKAGMKRMGSRNVGLDGVVEQQPNYRRSGFEYAYPNARFEGSGGGTAADGVIGLGDIPFDRLLAYDVPLFRARRADFLGAWIARPGGRALGVIDDGSLIGYGVIRPCRRGHKIGPLFADTPEAAERLFAALAASAPGQPVFLDVPMPNAEAVALAERHRMAPVFETARMYTRGDPGVPLARVYGITTFELG